MEKEKKLSTRYIELIYNLLSTTEEPAKWDDQVLDQLRLIKMDVRFVRAFFLCLTKWDYRTVDEDSMERLRSMIDTLLEIWGEEEEMNLLVHRLDRALRKRLVSAWHPLASQLQGKFHQSKLEIQSRWVSFFNSPPSSFRCKPSKSPQIIKFIDSTINNLNDLVKTGEIDRFMKQIETLEDKLIFLKTFTKLASNCIMDRNKLSEFNMFVQVFTNDAACLTFIYWAGADDNLHVK